jgi:hypothetical protein
VFGLEIHAYSWKKTLVRRGQIQNMVLAVSKRIQQLGELAGELYMRMGEPDGYSFKINRCHEHP